MQTSLLIPHQGRSEVLIDKVVLPSVTWSYTGPVVLSDESTLVGNDDTDAADTTRKDPPCQRNCGYALNPKKASTPRKQNLFRYALPTKRPEKQKKSKAPATLPVKPFAWTDMLVPKRRFSRLPLTGPSTPSSRIDKGWRFQISGLYPRTPKLTRLSQNW